ncbi:hypothetical protein H6501_03230 [Candidatus Woesearchaeota archaeon]|nr:hypothetical protein [Nanoarchaeota archaeon]MCB9370583.1 hypothetical protein [Candidatus Woesearchaeota archaeon]USN43665.1 MAG: hypothetical protein H6500_04715 [Candidatus Woesearchaeota archaeon]
MFKKKANIVAVLTISLVILSSLIIYFGNNPVFLTSADDTFSPSSSEVVISEVVRKAVYVGTESLLKNGYSKDSHAWFENGPYPPSFDEFVIALQRETRENIAKALESLNTTLSESLEMDTQNFEVTYDYDPTEKKLIFYVKNITYMVNKENIYLSKSLTYEFDFSSLFVMFDTMRVWNSEEGVPLVNDIANSFNATCSQQCSCGGLPESQVGESNFDPDWIRARVNESLKKLPEYFEETSIVCEYEIKQERLNENYEQSVYSAGDNSYCDTSQAFTSIGTEAVIWDEFTTIIDSSTLSYETPSFIHLERDLDTNEEIDVHTDYLGVPNRGLQNQGSGGASQSLQEKREPSAAMYIEVRCHDQNQFSLTDGESAPLISHFGIRFNVMKYCDLRPHNVLVDSSICEGAVGDCKGYGTCGYGAPECAFADDPPACPGCFLETCTVVDQECLDNLEEDQSAEDCYQDDKRAVTKNGECLGDPSGGPGTPVQCSIITQAFACGVYSCEVPEPEEEEEEQEQEEEEEQEQEEEEQEQEQEAEEQEQEQEAEEQEQEQEAEEQEQEQETEQAPPVPPTPPPPVPPDPAPVPPTPPPSW